MLTTTAYNKATFGDGVWNNKCLKTKHLPGTMPMCHLIGSAYFLNKYAQNLQLQISKHTHM